MKTLMSSTFFSKQSRRMHTMYALCAALLTLLPLMWGALLSPLY